MKKTFSGSGGQNKNFGIGPAAKELKRRAYASCNRTLAPPPPLTKPTIVHLARGVIREGMNTRRLVNANASIATLLKTFPKATVVERATRGGETPFCGQLDTYDAATVVLTPHGAHLVLAIFAPVNTIVLAKRAALRRNPTTAATCLALDKSVHEGKGKCKPGQGIFCNARNCWAKKECALCEP